MFHGQLRNVPFGTWRFRGSCSTGCYEMLHLEHGIAGGHVPWAAMRCSLWNVETEVRKMKRGNKLLDGPGTPSLMSVQELRLMALLRDLVGDVGQGEAADVLGIDRKTVWRSLGAGRLTPRLADALERLLLAGGGSAAARQREQVDALERRVPAEVPRAGDPRACRRRRGGVRSGVAADSRVAGAEGQPPQPGQGAVVARCGGAAHGGGGGASGGARADAAPETQPLRGLERGSQLNWRRAALYDTRRARAKRELLRRVLTLGLWRR